MVFETTGWSTVVMVELTGVKPVKLIGWTAFAAVRLGSVIGRCLLAVAGHVVGPQLIRKRARDIVIQ
jgi:hypothetical protein